jgi:hypothetical protein
MGARSGVDSMYERSFSSLLGCALHEAANNKDARLARVITSEEDRVDFIWQEDEAHLCCFMCVNG